jgi:tetratricopeptide (TPR) repeat protein
VAWPTAKLLRSLTPEELLLKAVAATTPAAKARCACRGLGARNGLDRTTHALLLRQLYLAHYESRQFDQAHALSLQVLRLGVLPDVAHQDVARASLARGDLVDALAHLRCAARHAPSSRRPFHLWTLGSTLFLAEKYAEARAVLARAARWGTHDKPLYRAHLALARLAMGERVEDLAAIMVELECAPCRRGYGQFLLGYLASAMGKSALARRYLRAFVRRTQSARAGLSIALNGELRMARATLLKIG